MGFGGYKTPVPGLYLSGSGTHPIAGINGMPGMNAAKTMIKVLAKEEGRAPVRSGGSVGGSGSRLSGTPGAAGGGDSNGARESAGEPAAGVR
jgi:hypothetical protein